MPATTPTNAQNSPLASDAHSVPLARPRSPCGRTSSAADQHDERDDRLVDRVRPRRRSPPTSRAPSRPRAASPPSERAVGAADAAQHDRGEDRQQEREAEVRVERALHERGEHAGEAGEQAREDPGLPRSPGRRRCPRPPRARGRPPSRASCARASCRERKRPTSDDRDGGDDDRDRPAPRDSRTLAEHVDLVRVDAYARGCGPETRRIACRSTSASPIEARNRLMNPARRARSGRQRTTSSATESTAVGDHRDERCRDHRRCPAGC